MSWCRCPSVVIPRPSTCMQSTGRMNGASPGSPVCGRSFSCDPGCPSFCRWRDITRKCVTYSPPISQPPPFPGIQTLVHSLPNFAGDVHVAGALEHHRLEDDAFLFVPAALSDSYEFHSQRVHEVPPESPARSAVMLHGHDHQVSTSNLPVSAVCYPSTEVLSIIGVHKVAIHLLDFPVLHRGYITGHIPHGPLASLCSYHFLSWTCCCRPCLPYISPSRLLCRHRWTSALCRLLALTLPPVCCLVFYLQSQRR